MIITLHILENQRESTIYKSVSGQKCGEEDFSQSDRLG